MAVKKASFMNLELLHLNLGGVDNFFLALHLNENLLTSNSVVEWHYPNGTVETMLLKTALSKNWGKGHSSLN